jgi:hypothetical protein
MSLTHWLQDRLARRRSKPDMRLRILNVTRHTLIAGCVEVADRGRKRRKGLLDREGLAAGEGMWIVPCESVHTFGMRFPIDLVYLDRKLHVKKVRSNVIPWRLSACLSAHSVVELVSGTIHKTQTRAGDQLEFSSADQENGGDASRVGEKSE